MKLNKERLDIRMYTWIYTTTKYDLPNNLCSFFWLYLLMWPLALIHITFLLPSVLLEIYNKENLSISNRLATSFFSYVLMLFLTSMIYGPIAYFLGYIDRKNPWFIMGEALWFTGIVLVIGFGIYKLQKWISSKKVKKEKTPSIIVEYIKAKKDKYCPKIDWV